MLDEWCGWMGTPSRSSAGGKEVDKLDRLEQSGKKWVLASQSLPFWDDLIVLASPVQFESLVR